MENSVYPSISDLAEALRRHVELREHCFASNGSITEVANTLTELAAALREELNSRSALFKLPVEIMHKILEQIPDPFFGDTDQFRPAWRSSAKNTYMLIPILQTCRQFRQLALFHCSLWKTVATTQRYYSLPPILLQKGCEVPLVAAIEGDIGDDDLCGIDQILDPHRMQELHIYNLYLRNPRHNVLKILRSLGQGLPLLESLSISRLQFVEEGGIIKSDECPFSLENAPRLRHMMLHKVAFIPTNAFPHLTHLVLSDIGAPHCHLETASLLSRCPNLESLAIHYPYTLEADAPLHAPSTALGRLRRASLVLPQFSTDSLIPFYLSLLPLDDPIALQILDIHTLDHAPQLAQIFSQVTNAQASHLALSLHPCANDASFKYLGVTAAGPAGTFHVSSTSFRAELEHRDHWDVDLSLTRFLRYVVGECNATSSNLHLRAVREVWLMGLCPATGVSQVRCRDLPEHLKATVTALPALETIVIVVTAAAGPQAESQLEADLSVCPSAHDGFVSPHLKTLRIVHGNDVESADKESVGKVRLTKLLEQMESGAYGYFENVLLQMTRPLEVDEQDLARLEALFRRVTFEHVHGMPEMPLPEYCTDPYAGPGGSSTWSGSLW